MLDHSVQQEVNRLVPRCCLFPRIACAQVVTQRLMQLATKGTPVHLPAEVIIRRRKRVRNSNGPSTDTWEMVRARGHLDEVEQLKSSAAPPSSAPPRDLSLAPLADRACLHLCACHNC